jgi:hypothetical protein
LVHLILYSSPFITAFLLSFPKIAIDLPLLICDALLRTLALTAFGAEIAIQSPYRGSWVTQIGVGGLTGSAAAIALLTLDLWSPSGWRFHSDNLSQLTWDVYGPFVLSAIHVALRGTHPAVNNISVFVTGATWGVKGTRYLNVHEARTVVALIFATVVILRRLGVYSFAFGQKFAGRKLGDDKKVR